ncbi:MAG: hypothetical protein D3914_04730 [Candidatus Electrothrix sp. LOE2]|nr:hypothetical protein [Candidatus Electrothrix sp. LOE2]
MEEKNNRRFSRLNIHWAVRLDFGTTEYKRFVHNVSLIGLYVEGEFRQEIGDICIINLKPSSLFSGETVRAVGTVTRISEHGMAMQFLSMKLDSFFFLQTTLFYKAVDPALLGREFIKNNINNFNIEGELVLFKPFSMDFQTMKQMQHLLLR